MRAASGTIELTNAVAGTGTLAIAGGTLQLDTMAANAQSVVFQAAEATSTLAFLKNGTFSGSISAFAAATPLTS